MATIRAEDAYGNVATGYMGTVHLTSSDMQATLPANSALTNGTGPFSVTLKTLGSQTITATDTVTASLKGTSSPINVVSNAATHLSVGGPGNIDTRKTFQLTVTALDAANNTSAVYTGEVHFTSSDSQAKLPADSTLTAGVATFSATLETVGSGTQTITGTDKATNSITGGVTIGVTAAPALTVSSSAPPAGTVGDTYNPHSVLVCYYNPFTHQRICHWVKENGFTLTGMGGVPPYSWSWAPGAGSSLPPGFFRLGLPAG